MVINILHSIGDILYCEPIYRHFWEKEGKKPLVVIRDHLMYLQDYIESACFIPASKWIGNIDNMEVTESYLPLRFANQILNKLAPHDHHDYENMMADKYRLAGLDPEMWKNIQLMFYPDRCTDVFEKLLLMPDSDYILVNEHSQAGSIEINPETDMRIVKMHEIPGYTVMDWFGVMMLAKENHHISTSTFYIFQAIKDLQSKVFIYPRPNEDGLRGISQLNTSFAYTKMS